MAAVVEKKAVGKVPQPKPEAILNDFLERHRQWLIEGMNLYEETATVIDSVTAGKCLHRNQEEIRTPGIRKRKCKDCGEDIP